MRSSAAAKSRPLSSGQDERETGLRAILNFGHTFGHAIENGLGYGQWLHGEAVGCGMVMAAHLSLRLGLVDAAFVARLTRLIERAGLPVVGPRLQRRARRKRRRPVQRRPLSGVDAGRQEG